MSIHGGFFVFFYLVETPLYHIFSYICNHLINLIMNCKNCGNEIRPGDVFCEVCGTKVSTGINEHPAAAENVITDNYRPIAKKKKNNSAIIITCAVLVALALIGGALYMGFSHQDEESLWSLCQERKEITDVKQYLDDYPNGEHFAEAKNLYDMLIAEKTAWEQVVANDDEDALHAFINNHPTSKYLAQAREMLDDVTWNNTVDKNTKEGYQRYISEFPNGKHVGEARSRFGELQRAELTLEERERVKQTIQQFLTGMEQWDAYQMMTVCNTEMDNFMGKPNAKHNDVREYLNAYRESDIDSIGFSSLAVDVKKTINDNNESSFNAHFTVTRQFKRQNAENGTVALMKGDAVVDCFFRFKSFTLDKITDQ